MSNVSNLNTDKTPRQIAEEELKVENSKRAVGTYKAKLKELEKARNVIANIERELEDLDRKIADGNLLDD